MGPLEGSEVIELDGVIQSAPTPRFSRTAQGIQDRRLLLERIPKPFWKMWF